MNINFNKIKLKNFLSFGNAETEINLYRPGTTFVIGKDLDNISSGEGGNGCGKTAILNALVFAVYDKPLSDHISKEGLVNYVNKKNMEVTIEFTKDDIEYCIKRTRKGKSGASVYLYKDKADITPDSIAQTNKDIESIIGVPYELFVRIVAFSATNQPFLALPRTSSNAANQTDIIEELFDLKTLSERATLLKDRIKLTDQDLKMHLAVIEQQEREHDRHAKQIETAKNRIEQWDIDRDNEIKTIQQKLDKIKDIDIEEQRQYHDDIAEVKSQLREAISNQTQIENTIRENLRKKKKIKKEVDALSNSLCPYCGQEYHETEEKLDKLEKELLAITEQGPSLEDDLGNIYETVTELQTKETSIKKKITVDNIKELIAISGKQEQMIARLTDLDKSENPHIETLEDLKQVILDQIDKSRINVLQNYLDHQKFLLKLLTKKDSFIRKTLLNKHIPYLNQRLSKYLTELGLTHCVTFTQEMTVSITKFGRELGFGNLSNGQKARVNLALSLAFRDLLENMHEVKINIYMLDEVLDVGLDTIGVYAAAKMLKNKGRDNNLSVYIISHRDEINSAFDNKMTVTLEKGFSYIED